MNDLRALFADLGYRDVGTVLNSGNVVFTAGITLEDNAAAIIQAAVESRLGVSARITLLSAETLCRVVDENPVVEKADNHSRLIVAFPKDNEHLAQLNYLHDLDFTPEVFAVGPNAAYFWCPNGVLDCRAMKSAADALGDNVTTRNWATVLKLNKLASG